MLSRIVNSQTKSITAAAVLVALSVLFSRLLGLVRDRLLAKQFGASAELDVYFTAFLIPDFVYSILILGGISAVFLPIFSGYYFKNKEEAWRFANNLLNCFGFLLILICSILAIITPFLIDLVVPGFSLEKKHLAVTLTRIMFFSPLFFGLASIFSGILQYFNRFLIYSLAPIIYNLGIIFGILFFVPSFGLYGLAYGVILGACLYWLIQIPTARISGYYYLPLFNFRNFGLIKALKQMIPRTIGAAAYQFNLIVITAIASTLASGSITIFNFANNLQYLPIGLIGVSFSLAVFPALSKNWAANQKDEFSKNFSSTFRQILFLVIPLSTLIFILRVALVRIILGTGRFGWPEIQLTAAALGIFSFGIFAATLIPFLSRVFYSFHDTKTPVIVSLIAIVLNLSLCFLFIFLLEFTNLGQESIRHILNLQEVDDIRVLALPLSLSISAVFQFSLLLFFLYQKKINLFLKEIGQSLMKILIATCLMVIFSFATLFLTNKFFNIQTNSGILLQTILVCLVAGIVYLLVSFWLKLSEIKVIWTLLFKSFMS
ncbi:MAG: murein biosynthesis integral membrane protein MurJ [Minisyncoccales bacterium]